MQIVPFQPKHLDPCARAFVATYNQKPWQEQWTFETARKRLLDILQTPGFLGLVYLDEEILGFVAGYCEQWYDSQRFYLKEFCVIPVKQRQGIGTRLLRHLEGRLKQMNINCLYLLTLAQEQLEMFYLAQGYHHSPHIMLLSKTL